jgi:hypothetical protein
MSIILVAAALEMVKTLRRSTAKSVEANWWWLWSKRIRKVFSSHVCKWRNVLWSNGRPFDERRIFCNPNWTKVCPSGYCDYPFEQL